MTVDPWIIAETPEALRRRVPLLQKPIEAGHVEAVIEALAGGAAA